MRGLGKIRIVKRKSLVGGVITTLLLSLFVFPVSAADYWSKPRPSDTTTYDEVIGNAHTDGKASVGLGVHICKYYEDDSEFGDFLTLRVSVSANTRVGINYNINPYSYVGWLSVSNPTGITSDNSGTWLDLPFVAVLFYGVYYKRVWVCDNGFLSFDSESTSPTPQAIPNTNKPNSLIAPFWRDLDPSMGGSITYGTIGSPPNDAFVISWNNVPNKANGVKQSFQVVIYRIGSFGQPSSQHNRIYFQYGSITKDYPTVVGVEDVVGDIGSSYDYNAITSNSALEVRYPVSGYRLERLRIKLSKSDAYAKIELQETYIGGYNVILENPEEDISGDIFVDAVGFAAVLLLETAKVGVVYVKGFEILLIVMENAFKLAGALSEPVFGVEDADVDENMAYVTSEALSEEGYGKPFDATLAAGFMWFFTDPNNQNHDITITAELQYLELLDDMVYNYYTIDTSVSLNMYKRPPNTSYLTVLAKDQFGNSLTTGDVYVDGQLVGYTGLTFPTLGGTHTVKMNDFWEAGQTGYRYGFKNWTDGSVDNPRAITVVEDKTITAYFRKKWCPGDVDGDGRVGYMDMGLLSAAYGSRRGDPKWDSRCDMNGDGRVGYPDYGMLAGNYGKTYPDP